MRCEIYTIAAVTALMFSTVSTSYPVHAASTVQNFGANTKPITASINKAGRIVGDTIDHYWDITYRPISPESGSVGRQGPTRGIVAKTTVKPEEPETSGAVDYGLGGRVEMASAQAAGSARAMKIGNTFPKVSVPAKIQDPVAAGMDTKAVDTKNLKTGPRVEDGGSCAVCGD